MISLAEAGPVEETASYEVYRWPRYETVVGWCPDGYHHRHDHPPIRQQWEKWERWITAPSQVLGDPRDWEEICSMETGAIFRHPEAATKEQMMMLFALALQSLEAVVQIPTYQWGWEVERMWRRRRVVSARPGPDRRTNR